MGARSCCGVLVAVATLVGAGCHKLLALHSSDHGGPDHVPFDTNRNGSLDLTPGMQTAEERLVLDACGGDGHKVIHVHKLRYAFFLAIDAARGSRALRLTVNDALEILDTARYTLGDREGEAEIAITAVNPRTGEVTLATPLPRAFRVAAGAAVLYPLQGLRNNHACWVVDSSSAELVRCAAAHELGHAAAGLRDVCEGENLMAGTGHDTTGKLRHRPLKQYRDRSTPEEQWLGMKRV